MIISKLRRWSMDYAAIYNNTCCCRVKPTSTWQNVREIVEKYYSSTFVPNPTTGHIAYLAHGSPEEQVNYVKGRRKGKGKGKGGKGKKGGDHYKGKGKGKSKGKSGDKKGKGKGYNKGGKGYYQGWNSWSQAGYNNKGQGKSKGKGGKTGATTQCHVCKKFGHVAANCWYKDSTYTTAAVGSVTTGQTQHYSMDHPANRLPSCIEINYHSTTSMDSVSQEPTCRLHQHQEQLPQALRPTSLLQDLYYTTSVMFIVKEMPTTATTCLRSATIDN